MSTRKSIGFALMAVALAFLIGPVQAANWTNSVNTGDWNTPANWSPNDVPDTVTEPALLTNSLNAGPYTCRVDAVMYPSGLTCGSIGINSGTMASKELSAKILVARDLTMNVGDVANPSRINVEESAAIFSNVVLNVTHPGTTSSGGLHVDKTIRTREWGAQFIDSSLAFTTAAAGGTNSVILYGGYPVVGTEAYRNARVSLERSSLTATNSNGSAGIFLLNKADSPATTTNFNDMAVLSLSDSTLLVDRLWVSYMGHVIFDGGNASPSVISNVNLNVSRGGRMTLKSGSLRIIGSLSVGTLGRSSDPWAFVQLVVTGAQMTVGGDIMWSGSAGTTHSLQATNTLDIYSGSLAVGGNIQFGHSRYLGDPQNWLRIFGGSLTVSNGIYLGQNLSNTNKGSLYMYGGLLTVSNIVVGAPTQGRGSYSQTGGTNTVLGAITLETTNSAGCACEQFVIDTNATLILKGRGLVKDGTTGWSTTLLTPANLSFAGRTVYDPVGVNVQTNYGFGKDVGAVVDGLTNLGAVGTWDLSALDGTETLKVVAAGNETTNAVYVRSLIGPADGNPSNHLQSAVNIYYDARYSSSFSSPDILLSGNGRLKAISSTKAGTLMYVE